MPGYRCMSRPGLGRLRSVERHGLESEPRAVAVAHEPREAIPRKGHGSDRSDHLAMKVAVKVTAANAAPDASARAGARRSLRRCGGPEARPPRDERGTFGRHVLAGHPAELRLRARAEDFR